jgi:DNA-binding IclR family transcriptional regulator
MCECCGVDDAEFARWSRAVFAFLSSAPEAPTSAEIAEGIGCDPAMLEEVLGEMKARGLIRPDPDRASPTGEVAWRHR